MSMKFLPRAGFPMVGRYSNVLVRFGSGACAGSALAGACGLGTLLQVGAGCIVGLLLAWSMRNRRMSVEVVSGRLEPR